MISWRFAALQHAMHLQYAFTACTCSMQRFIKVKNIVKRLEKRREYLQIK